MQVGSLALGLLAVLSVATAQAMEVTIAGSTTVQKRIIEPGASALKAATGVDVTMQGSGTGKGMIALFEGKVPAAAASEPLQDAIGSAQNAAKEMEKTITVPGNLQFHVLAPDVIVIIVNKENKIGSLTKEQIKDLNTGKVKNWKEIGGADLPVKVVTSHSGSATRAMVQKMVMDGADYAPGALEVRTTREEITEVGREPGAIGAVSEGFFEQNPGRAKTVKAPAITRPLALVTRGNPTAGVKKIIDFFRSRQGKKLMQ